MDHNRAQISAHRQIASFGGTAALKRGGVERPCTAALLRYVTADREGSLIQFGDSLFLISGLSLEDAAPPDNELDTLVVEGVEYRIIAPPSKLSPDSKTILYWEIACRK